MARVHPFLFSITLLLSLMAPTAGRAQQWAGIIAPSRATDWSTVGVVGGIPSGSWANCVTSACNTLNGGTVTLASINNALSSAGAIATAGNPQVVRIPAGSFSIAGCIRHTYSNVVLRGAGADQTKLSITANCTGGGLGTPQGFEFISGANGLGCASSCGGAAPTTVATWSAGYSQGTTTITLSSVAGLTAGPAGAGSVIFLDQLDDVSGGGYPTSNDVLQCSAQGAWCSNKGAGNQYGQPGRSQIQAVSVTAISGTGPYAVTISPAVAYDTYRAGQSPNAWWNSTQIHNSGLEDFSIDFTSSGANMGFLVKDGSNLWMTGLRILNTDSSTAAFYTIWFQNVAHAAVESNYFWGKDTNCITFPLENYSISAYEYSDLLADNNIFVHPNNPIVPTDPGGRDVWAYNYVVGGIVGADGAQPHGGEQLMDLFEGNDWQSYYGDVTHGTHNFMTLYRNLFEGTAVNNSCTVGQAISFLTNNRFNNVIGNVFGNTSYTQYEDDLDTTGNPPASLFSLGGIGNNSGTAVNADPNVKRTLMRWGNWDMFTSSNRTGANDLTGIRWCGNSSDTNWSVATNCNSASEVPSGIANYSNPVPTKGDTNAGQGVLPASFYLNSKPSWFGSVAFPAIGPDVSSGNATNTPITPSGGHANKIPARVCYESLSSDPAYAISPTPVQIFNGATCYGGGISSVQPPTNLQVTVQ